MENKQKDTDISYTTWAFVTGVVIFVGVWIYAITQWGFLLGIMFGWIPALIVAVIGGFLWPVLVLIILIIVLFYLYLFLR